jgi:hypothetical protein
MLGWEVIGCFGKPEVSAARGPDSPVLQMHADNVVVKANQRRSFRRIFHV